MLGLEGRRAAVAALTILLTVVSGVLSVTGRAPMLRFVVSGLALAGLAWAVSVSTEMVGRRVGPGATGVLQSTLGNLPELFAVVFAPRAGQIVVAESSIVGSLVSNALLVLGLVIVAGTRSWRARADSVLDRVTGDRDDHEASHSSVGERDFRRRQVRLTVLELGVAANCK
jgi:calcium/proton exchanger cax